MKPEDQLKQLSNDIEGYFNDFEGGITNKEDTITGLIDYVLKRVEIANNFKLNKIIKEIGEMACLHINPADEYEKGSDAFARIIIGIIKKELIKTD